MTECAWRSGGPMRWHENLFTRRQAQHEAGPGPVAVRLVIRASISRAARAAMECRRFGAATHPGSVMNSPLVPRSIGILS